jgi:D-glycero-alpha-D-manno-heptose 1-phosphate guanylyltransferase
MIKQAIILAGGLGTRLRSVVPDLPKCMAVVAGKPFLYYVINNFKKEGITDFIFSLGYKNEIIKNFVKDDFKNENKFRYGFSVEEQPLGTGGAIKLAVAKTTYENILVCNGDTLFKVNVRELSKFHESHHSDCALSLKPMKDFDRYGVVECDNDQSVVSFKEKKYYASGLINGGVYALNAIKFQKENLPDQFSFEKDYLERFVKTRRMFGFIQDTYFIDIGIPEDYERARSEYLELE